jgi:hypothetical protein
MPQTLLKETYILLYHETHSIHVRFVVLIVASMKMTAFWDTTPCTSAKADRHLIRAVTVRTSETSVYFKESAWHRENLKSHVVVHLRTTYNFI